MTKQVVHVIVDEDVIQPVKPKAVSCGPYGQTVPVLTTLTLMAPHLEFSSVFHCPYSLLDP